MLISIIIAVKNNHDQLCNLLHSIWRQAVPSGSYEVVVVDACSTDGTIDVLRKEKSRVAWWVSEPDNGVYDAWNKALKHAKGRWICFIGSDDFLVGDSVLADIIPHLLRAESLANLYAYAPVNLYSWADSKVKGQYNPEPAELARTLNAGRFILHSGSFHHRDFFQRYGLFDDTYKIAGDYALILKYLKDNPPYYIPFPVLNMGMGGMSMGRSLRFNWRSFRENLRAYRETLNGFPWRIYARFLLKLIRGIRCFHSG